MTERLAFISACLNRAEAIADICDQFGISEKTGYKFLKRSVAQKASGQPQAAELIAPSSCQSGTRERQSGTARASGVLAVPLFQTQELGGKLAALSYRACW